VYVGGHVSRGGIVVVVGSVGIQGVKIQIEPVREVPDKLKREALNSNMALSSSYVGEKG
jgi:hypothetical protein